VCRRDRNRARSETRTVVVVSRTALRSGWRRAWRDCAGGCGRQAAAAQAMMLLGEQGRRRCGGPLAAGLEVGVCRTAGSLYPEMNLLLRMASPAEG